LCLVLIRPSGKTHTIVGSQNDPGIIYLAMKDLFFRLRDQESSKIFDVSLSYLEVYNETIRDLLSETVQSGLDLREDENQIVVAGLSEHSPRNEDEVMELLVRGNENRTRAPTEANAVSSRSHAVLQVKIRQRDKTQGTCVSWTNAVLSIIDLAGSEVFLIAFVSRNSALGLIGSS
jgi:kinesin family protein 18/19